MTTLALLTTALLFGGAVLFSFGFAVFLLKNTEEKEARRLLRAAFPHFYTLVIALSALAAALALPSDTLSAGILAAIALSTIPARQVLMPAINAATDAGDKARFGRLHGVSVVLGLVHIAGMAYVLTRFV
ncbi:hypothetical protein FIU97_05540 [Roseivivax sp. THAF40]|uniref:DUF4149 domain-containing protein n=1 Tax=unclassified Roseivivax TaxID=2639302 RepID=UPI0012695EBA|nr:MULTISPECIES: DUF4149 domain-containing protein [unclassified Roseivivax]QFS82237.1 hypothetical protein FIV09_05280 [Roseivivax sp. THAF197b]QFT46037.1 hypothetical protein FIU97_05540 [Roseivivax sp. THAF40]